MVCPHQSVLSGLQLQCRLSICSFASAGHPTQRTSHRETGVVPVFHMIILAPFVFMSKPPGNWQNLGRVCWHDVMTRGRRHEARCSSQWHWSDTLKFSLTILLHLASSVFGQLGSHFLVLLHSLLMRLNCPVVCRRCRFHGICHCFIFLALLVRCDVLFVPTFCLCEVTLPMMSSLRQNAHSIDAMHPNSSLIAAVARPSCTRSAGSFRHRKLLSFFCG